jgi:hypothetical protein
MWRGANADDGVAVSSVVVIDETASFVSTHVHVSNTGNTTLFNVSYARLAAPIPDAHLQLPISEIINVDDDSQFVFDAEFSLLHVERQRGSGAVGGRGDALGALVVAQGVLDKTVYLGLASSDSRARVNAWVERRAAGSGLPPLNYDVLSDGTLRGDDWTQYNASAPQLALAGSIGLDVQLGNIVPLTGAQTSLA